MKTERTKTASGDLIATREEIDRAIEGLTEVQLLKLQRFAAWRIRGLGRAALGREAKDLLGEALSATLAGADGSGEGRRWNKTVDFEKHLTEAMRSISSHWRQAFDENEAQLESELVTTDPAGEDHSPMQNVKSEQPSTDRAFAAKEEVARVFAIFKDDDEAILVLQGWIEGMTGTEMLDLGFTKQQYEAAVKRIRYALRDKAGR
jgi:hypothetical protein